MTLKKIHTDGNRTPYLAKRVFAYVGLGALLLVLILDTFRTRAANAQAPEGNPIDIFVTVDEGLTTVSFKAFSNNKQCGRTIELPLDMEPSFDSIARSLQFDCRAPTSSYRWDKLTLPRTINAEGTIRPPEYQVGAFSGPIGQKLWSKFSANYTCKLDGQSCTLSRDPWGRLLIAFQDPLSRPLTGTVELKSGAHKVTLKIQTCAYRISTPIIPQSDEQIVTVHYDYPGCESGLQRLSKLVVEGQSVDVSGFLDDMEYAPHLRLINIPKVSPAQTPYWRA